MTDLTKRHLFIFTGFVLFSLVFLPLNVLADNFPSKPVTMIVPYRAGGSTDTMARVLAKALKKELGKPVVVVNRKGGGGSVGASYLNNSAPDGYTFMLGGDDIVTWNPLVHKVEFKRDDFRYLAAIAEYQNAIITLNDKPYKTLKELVEYSKSHPGIRYAYQTPLDKKVIDTILKKEGLDWTLVSTTGGGEAMQFLLGDKIDVTYSGGAHNKYRGKITVLSSLNKNRLAGDPDVPTLKELGYGISMPSYVVFMTPVGVPDEIAGKLENAILKASQDKDFKTIVEERLKSPIIKVTSEELGPYMTNLGKELKALQSK
jgi:tripartite-type tricarboxylate transporter receptor subunit TctC